MLLLRAASAWASALRLLHVTSTRGFYVASGFLVLMLACGFYIAPAGFPRSYARNAYIYNSACRTEASMGHCQGLSVLLFKVRFLGFDGVLEAVTAPPSAGAWGVALLLK